MTSTQSPIPPRIVGYLGGSGNDGMAYFVLWKDGNLLVVQGRCATYPKQSEDGLQTTPEQWIQAEKDYFYMLEVIQACLQTVQFGLSNWAYLVHTKKEGYRLNMKQRDFYRITCPRWAPMIQEDDILIIKWNSPESRIGIWKGKEVDVLYGWNEFYLGRVDRAMQLHRSLAGLGLTFDVLGHLVDKRTNNVLGLVTEAAIGRAVDTHDRPIVYQAIAKLQSLGFLFKGTIDKIMISNQNVRILDLSESVDYIGNQGADLVSETEFHHWQYLDKIFMSKTRPPTIFARELSLDIIHLPQTPCPERLWGTLSRLWFPYTFDDSKRMLFLSKDEVLLKLRNKRPRLDSLPDDDDKSSHSTASHLDTPISNTAIRNARQRLRNQCRSHHPYQRAFGRPLLFRLDDSDCTSESGQSA